MRILVALWQALDAWFARAVPATEPACDEDRRCSVRQVTLEQLGITHWSCHSHF
ncbi:hypothetical protein [Bosea sp. AS-1]|jgi:hypothetical protein|uniref:hypothetical protein n=1 Tax=Bosea sp. AS-1 TaxID=2015316 RepID=UPI0012FE5614|nr:hypothetical protein [Bosea sp. AS-1]